jgi:predicted transcriptional regulator
MNKALNDIVRRADAWPDAAQQELADLAQEIDAELNAGAYSATTDELAGIDRGLSDADQGRFVTDAEIETVFAKHRKG